MHIYSNNNIIIKMKKNQTSFIGNIQNWQAFSYIDQEKRKEKYKFPKLRNKKVLSLVNSKKLN